MDKKSKEIIIEVIEELLKHKNKEIDEVSIKYKYKIDDRIDTPEKRKKKNFEAFEKYKNMLVKLNKLLKKEEQFKEIIDIEAQMKKIQVKNNITIKEFSEIYNISKTSQQNYRSRLNDPLPYHQKVAAGKIVYVVKEVEEWFENQHK